MNSFREPSATILKHFLAYHELWEGERQEIVSEFTNPVEEGACPPSLSDLKAEIQKYVNKIEDIELIEESFVIGSLSLSSANIKLALVVEAKAWKHELSKHMHKQYLKKMEDTFNFIDEVSKKLGRQIRDLDDVRFAMEI